MANNKHDERPLTGDEAIEILRSMGVRTLEDVRRLSDERIATLIALEVREQIIANLKTIRMVSGIYPRRHDN